MKKLLCDRNVYKDRHPHPQFPFLPQKCDILVDVNATYRKSCLKRTCSKAATCLHRTNDFASKYQFTGQSLINITCLKPAKIIAPKVSALDRFYYIIAIKACSKNSFMFISYLSFSKFVPIQCSMFSQSRYTIFSLSPKDHFKHFRKCKI